MRIRTSSLLVNALFIIAGISSAIAAPVNDSWETATTITGLPVTVMGHNVGATAQLCEPIHGFPDQPAVQTKSSVWYKWQPPAAGSYTISTIGSEFDLTISVYTIHPGPCNGGTTNIPYRRIEGRNFNANIGFDERARISFRAGGAETIYISVDSVGAQTGAFTIKLEKTKYDYGVQLDHSNGAADLAINDGNATWWISRHLALADPLVSTAFIFGTSDDRKFLADFDGDAVSDVVSVRRENGVLTWWVSNKFGSLLKVVQFGLESDRPIVGDWDGDGIADMGAIRHDAAGNKIWYIMRSSDGQYQAFQYGLLADEAMVGDYDGDGKTDITALRINVNGPYTWYIHLSSNDTDLVHQFGDWVTDYPVAANFDGDGKTDIAVFRSSTGTWYSIDSNSQLPLGQRPIRVVKFGQGGDRPQAADFDGDRKTDTAVYRAGQWWIRHSRTGLIKTYQYGVNNSLPMSDGGIQNAFGHY